MSCHILIVNFPASHWNISPVNDAERLWEDIKSCMRYNWPVGIGLVPSLVSATVMHSEFSETDPLEQGSPNPRRNGCLYKLKALPKRLYLSFLTDSLYLEAQLSRYSDWLRVRRSGDRITVAERISAPVQTGPRANPASYTMGTRSFRGVSGRAVALIIHPI